MLTDLCSKISTISFDLLLIVPIFTLHICKSTNLLSTWCCHWMVVWLGLHLPLVLLCIVFSLYAIPMAFNKFGQPIAFVISWILMWQNFMTICPFWCQRSMVMRISIFIANTGWSVICLPKIWRPHPNSYQTEISKGLWGKSVTFAWLSVENDVIIP